MKIITVGCNMASSHSVQLQAAIAVSLSVGMAAVIDEEIDYSPLDYELHISERELTDSPVTLPKKKRGKHNHINPEYAWMRRHKRPKSRW